VNFGRRRFALVAVGLLGAWLPPAALGADADPAVTSVRAFYVVLLDGMKRAATLGIRGRYDRFAPAVRATFDLPAMTRIAVGPAWNMITPDEQMALVEAFSRMTIATYANRFDGFSGERFEVEPITEARNANRIVRTKIIPVKKDPVALNYLFHQSPEGWKAIDVHLTGTISELATKRSEFSSLLKAGGAPALITSLRERGDKLLAG